MNVTGIVPETTPVDECVNWTSNTGNQTSGYGLSLPYQYAYGTACGLITLLGAVGNAVVIWICLYYRRMRTITNFFIANLAISDFVGSVLNVPLTSYFILTQEWRFGLFCCVFTNFIASITVVASVFTMMCISIDRYIAIVHPMRPRMGRITAYFIIGTIWFSAGMFSLPTLLYSTTHRFNETGQTICFLEWEKDIPVSSREFVYQCSYMLITYFIPLIALTFAYGRVAEELWGTKSIGEATIAQMEQIKSKRKLVKVLIWVMVTFMICWAPYHCWFIVTSINGCIRRLENMSHVFTSAYVLAMSNSIYNPMIYIILNNKFRQGFRQVFRWLPCVDWHPTESLDRSQTTVGSAVYHFRDRISSCCTDTSGTRNGSLALHQHGYVRANGTHLHVPRTSISVH